MIHDPPRPPLQIPPLAGARLNAPEAYHQGVDAGAPGGVSPNSLAGGTSPAARVHGRHRQIDKFGHTPQADAALPLKHLPGLARQALTDAIEDVQFHRPDWRKHARRHLVAAGAMVLAAIDRLDAEPPQPEIEL